MSTSNLRLACISVDLDEIGCYASIYGRPVGNGAAQGPIYKYAVPRYRALFDELKIPATFFAIGRDLRLQENARAMKSASDAGVEISNHSLDHLYDLSRLPKAAMAHQVRGGANLIEGATGVRPVGFRAPGYTVSDPLFDVFRNEALLYDSSVFPCPAYYSLKTAAIGAISLRARLGCGRPSHSVVDTPKVLAAPADPYLAAKHAYYECGEDEEAVLELPIGVTRGMRLPYIGTSVVLGADRGTRAADILTRQMVGRPFVNLELHGIDLSDANHDGFGALSDLPELRVPVGKKRAALVACVRRLEAAGYTFVTMKDAAELFLAELRPVCAAHPVDA